MSKPHIHYRITRPVKLRLQTREERKRERETSTKSCPHRGDQLRTMTSDLCGTRGHDLPVYACDLHGECTHRQVCKGQDAAVRICVGCSDGPWAF
jgi:hypothetical protein